MKPTTKVIWALTILMTVVSTGAYAYVAHSYGNDCPLLKVIPFMSAFFVLFGTLTIISLDSLKGDGQKYMRAFMVLTAIKFFSALIGCVLYVVFNREFAVPFLVIFLVYYVIYLVFEVFTSQKLNKGLTK
ncbi:MAG: hypothetical protein IK005_11505 [Paludibacteraceae bacterium]|nr:hypothetical protein [Paludibacteraceae bacterium]MBR4841085.1 hypothetical protein [Paludibacteraceae bacterium]